MTSHANPPAPDISQRPAMPTRRIEVGAAKTDHQLMSDERARELLVRSRALLERARHSLIVHANLGSPNTVYRTDSDQLYLDICEELGINDVWCKKCKFKPEPT